MEEVHCVMAWERWTSTSRLLRDVRVACNVGRVREHLPELESWLRVVHNWGRITFGCPAKTG